MPDLTITRPRCPPRSAASVRHQLRPHLRRPPRSRRVGEPRTAPSMLGLGLRQARPGWTGCATFRDQPRAARRRDPLLDDGLNRASVTDDGDTHKAALPDLRRPVRRDVLMLYPDRATVCVSFQFGCAVGCAFCATGLAGSPQPHRGEIVQQTVDAPSGGIRRRHLTNLVMMAWASAADLCADAGHHRQHQRPSRSNSRAAQPRLIRSSCRAT